MFVVFQYVNSACCIVSRRTFELLGKHIFITRSRGHSFINFLGHWQKNALKGPSIFDKVFLTRCHVGLYKGKRVLQLCCCRPIEYFVACVLSPIECAHSNCDNEGVGREEWVSVKLTAWHSLVRSLNKPNIRKAKQRNDPWREFTKAWRRLVVSEVVLV